MTNLDKLLQEAEKEANGSHADNHGGEEVDVLSVCKKLIAYLKEHDRIAKLFRQYDQTCLDIELEAIKQKNTDKLSELMVRRDQILNELGK